MTRLASLFVLLVAPGALAAQQGQAGAYVTRRGDVEVARERYRLEGKTLVADVEVVGMGLFYQTQTAFDSTGSATRYHLRARRGVGGPMLQELDVTVDDSVRWTLAAGDRAQRGSVPIGRPAVVVQNLVFSQLAASVRAYDRPKGGRQILNAWLPEGGIVLPLAVELRGDSGTLEIGGVSLHVVLDRFGWVARFEVPVQGVVVTRQDDVAFSPRPTSGLADTLPPSTIFEEPYLIEGGGARLVGTLTLPGWPSWRSTWIGRPRSCRNWWRPSWTGWPAWVGKTGPCSSLSPSPAGRRPSGSRFRAPSTARGGHRSGRSPVPRPPAVRCRPRRSRACPGRRRGPHGTSTTR